MATFDSYPTSIKCWLKLHSNLKEGDVNEDRKAKMPVSRLAAVKQPTRPRCGAAGGQRSHAAVVQPSCLLMFGESLSLVL